MYKTKLNKKLSGKISKEKIVDDPEAVKVYDNKQSAKQLKISKKAVKKGAKKNK